MFEDGYPVRVTELMQWADEVPDLAALPKVGNAEDAVFMANSVRLEKGRFEEKGLNRFWSRLRQVAALPCIEGILAPPLSIALCRPKGQEAALLCSYFKSSKSMDELNNLLGKKVFTPEGEIGEEL